MTGRKEARSLELHFIDGKPDGMLTAEVFNWTGHVLMAPRTQISAALARKEARYPGIYILLGEQDGEPLGYIGEGEDISHRIKSHDANRDWWTTLVLVTSSANNLHKAHVQYLESRLIEVARAVGRTKLENSTSPSLPSLSEAAQSNMESFLDYLFMVLPALRIDMFVARTRPSTTSLPQTTSAPVFELKSQRHDIKATAVLEHGEFIVQAGSLARPVWSHAGTLSGSYGQLHAELIRSGVLVQKGANSEFVKSYAFTSPSAAASVINARHSNGRRDWKLLGTGQTYEEWEAAQLAVPSLEAE